MPSTAELHALDAQPCALLASRAARHLDDNKVDLEAAAKLDENAVVKVRDPRRLLREQEEPNMHGLRGDGRRGGKDKLSDERRMEISRRDSRDEIDVLEARQRRARDLCTGVSGQRTPGDDEPNSLDW